MGWIIQRETLTSDKTYTFTPTADCTLYQISISISGSAYVKVTAAGNVIWEEQITDGGFQVSTGIPLTTSDTVEVYVHPAPKCTVWGSIVTS